MKHKTDMNITKIGKYKKTKHQFYDKTQNRQEHYWNWQIQKTDHDGTQTDINITKYKKSWTAIVYPSTKHMNITKYKKLNMTDHKTDMNITEKPNSNSTTEYKTTMNITVKLSCTCTKEH